MHPTGRDPTEDPEQFPPRRPRWWPVAAGLAALALGVLLGAATGGVAVTPAGATPPAAVTVTTTVTKAVVPGVCLSAMRQGDAVIGLLDKDERDRQLGELLKSYTVAAQSCRKEVSRR